MFVFQSSAHFQGRVRKGGKGRYLSPRPNPQPLIDNQGGPVMLTVRQIPPGEVRALPPPRSNWEDITLNGVLSTTRPK